MRRERFAEPAKAATEEMLKALGMKRACQMITYWSI
jgi:hypothetical protein